MSLFRELPVEEPGIYDITAPQYHADPCPQPSLSHSIAKLLLNRSPMHAYNAHPRYGRRARKRGAGDRDMAIGSTAHAMMLGKGADLIRIDADDYRTNAAKQARDAAYAQGSTPIIKADWEKAEALAAPARAAVEAWLGGPLAKCFIERAYIVRENGHWRRSMMDIVTPDLRFIVDYKTTTVSASPEDAKRRVWSLSYDTQVAFYLHMLNQLDPAGRGRRRFVFLFQEQDCPEALSLHELDDGAEDLAAQKVARALANWDECQASNKWPGYEVGPHPIAPKPWELSDDIIAEEEEAA